MPTTVLKITRKKIRTVQLNTPKKTPKKLNKENTRKRMTILKSRQQNRPQSLLPSQNMLISQKSSPHFLGYRKIQSISKKSNRSLLPKKKFRKMWKIFKILKNLNNSQSLSRQNQSNRRQRPWSKKLEFQLNKKRNLKKSKKKSTNKSQSLNPSKFKLKTTKT